MCIYVSNVVIAKKNEGAVLYQLLQLTLDHPSLAYAWDEL